MAVQLNNPAVGQQGLPLHKSNHEIGGVDQLTPADIGAATAAQGTKADTALQPGALPLGTTIPSAQISDATTVGKNLLTAVDAAAQRTSLGLGTAAIANSSSFATSSQGAKADTALQPGALPAETTLPAAQISDSTTTGRALITAVDAAAQRTSLGLGTAATANSSSFATSAQGTKADTALQPGALPVGTTMPAAQISDSTSAGRSLITAVDAAAQRTLLELGSAATFASTTFALSGAIGSSGLTVSTSRLLGRTTASSGSIEEISIGSNLSLSNGILSATGTGGTSNLGYTASATNGQITNTDGTGATIPLSDSTNAGLMAPAQHSKLAGIAAGATANATDAQLRDRATHTGTQAGSTITGAYTSAAMTVATSRLLGRTSAGTGAAEEISVGANLTLAAGSLVVNTARLGIQSAVTELVDAMMSAAASSLMPVPTPAKPYSPSGTTYYVDPTVVGPGAGTFADPWKSPTSATLSPGQALLFKAGTTTTLTGSYYAGSSGTATNPVIYGIYDPTTGNRITGPVGAATINCGGGAFQAFDIFNSNFVEISNLNFTGKTGATNAYITVGGSSANCMVRNCSFASTTSDVISIGATGTGHIVQGNSITAGSATAITLSLFGDDATSTILFNQVNNCSARGIFIYDQYASRRFSGVIAGNSVHDCQVVGGGAVELITSGGSPKIYRNTISRARNGVRVISSVGAHTVASDYSGMSVESNYISNCEYGIGFAGVIGSWAIQGNRIEKCGSFDDTNSISSDCYGRGIELFGASHAMAVMDGVVRWNSVGRCYNFSGAATPGSEGVGIGVDNRCRNITVYGNVTYRNGGNGIQVNEANGTLVCGNISIDDITATYAVDSRFKAGITFVASPYTRVINNTVVQTGRTNQTVGISDSNFSSSASVVRNNLCISPATAAIRYNSSNTTESHNVCVGPAVAANMSDVVVSAGTGSSTQTEVAVGAYAPMYRPVAAGPCDGTGTATLESWVSLFDGTRVGPMMRPIGAQPVQFPT